MSNVELADAAAQARHAGPYQVVKDFEAALCDYTGAPIAVTTTSCTMALLLACAYHKVQAVTVPKRTYLGVPMSVIHAGGWPVFEDIDWQGIYRLAPYPIWDAARRFTSGMYAPLGGMVCVSFHWSKILGVEQGGAILLDDAEAAAWLRRARFDGRGEGLAPKDDEPILGWHAYMTPETAAKGLMRLALLPDYNDDLPWDAYPDLSEMEVFKKYQPAHALREVPTGHVATAEGIMRAAASRTRGVVL